MAGLRWAEAAARAALKSRISRPNNRQLLQIDSKQLDYSGRAYGAPRLAAHKWCGVRPNRIKRIWRSNIANKPIKILLPNRDGNGSMDRSDPRIVPSHSTGYCRRRAAVFPDSGPLFVEGSGAVHARAVETIK